MTLNRRFGYVVGAVYILALNHADDGLHFATAAVALGLALAETSFRGVPSRA